MTPPAVLFLGLATYSRIGGLQNFNRRQIANLLRLAAEGTVARLRVHLTDDRPQDLPDGVSGVVAFGGDRPAFITRTLGQARACDRLLIGHINLLPVAWLAKRLNPRLRLILFVHGDEVWNGAARARRPYEPWMLRAVETVASVSQHTASVMAAEYGVPPERFALFPNAVDPIAEVGDEPSKPGDVVLAVSRIGLGDRRKNIDQLIRAIALLKAQGKPGRLEVVGDGALRPELEALARDEGVADRVTFLGRVDDAALAAAYRRASVFALPSSKEGFGIVYLEAWLRGLPVICGTLGAAREIIDDGVDGRIADESDASDIADKLEDLLSRSDAAQMGRNGLNKVLTRFMNANAVDNLRRLVTA